MYYEVDKYILSYYVVCIGEYKILKIIYQLLENMYWIIR